MRFFLFFVFLGVPLIEIGLFIAVGSRIGIFPTLALCVGTALLGSVLVRQQGLSTLARLRAELDAGHMPATQLAEGAAILAGGLLLITPGFFTDTCGFLLLLPPTRRLIIAWLGRYLGDKIEIIHGGPGRPGGPGGQSGPYRRDEQDSVIIIEGEAEEIGPQDTDGEPNPESPWRR
jgi:UPF0716 protein FxsA